MAEDDFDPKAIVDEILESVDLEEALEIYGARRREAREEARRASEITKELVIRGEEAKLSDRRMSKLLGLSNRSAVQTWLGKKSHNY